MSDDSAIKPASGAPLSAAEIEHFKVRLEAQQEALHQRMAAQQQSLAAPDQYGEAMQERGDDATLLRAHDDSWDQLAFLRSELDQVDKALARITAGTYGVSELSGTPIPRERLE